MTTIFFLSTVYTLGIALGTFLHNNHLVFTDLQVNVLICTFRA